MQKYSIVYADPPWDYKGQKQHAGKGKGDSGGAASHYGTVKLSRLKSLPVAEVCPAVCSETGLDAYYTVAKVNGLNQIDVGGSEKYVPRCHSLVPFMID